MFRHLHDKDFTCSELNGYTISEGKVLSEKQYEEIVPWWEDREKEEHNSPNDNSIFSIIPDNESTFQTIKRRITTDDGVTRDIILFNRDDVEIFENHKNGTTFLFVPFSESYRKNQVRRGEWIDSRVKLLKNKKELSYEFTLNTMQSIKEKIEGKKIQLSYWAPCSVDGYERNDRKIGTVKLVHIREDYGIIEFTIIFTDGDDFEVDIDSEINFEEKDEEFCIDFAGATATNVLTIELLE